MIAKPLEKRIKIDFGLKSSESDNIKFRSSLYFIRDLDPGDLIDENTVKSVRPYYGVQSKLLGSSIGKRVKRQIHCNTPILTSGL